MIARRYRCASQPGSSANAASRAKRGSSSGVSARSRAHSNSCGICTAKAPAASAGQMSERSELPTITAWPRRGAVAGEHARVGLGGLLADDLDAGEMIAEAGGRELEFLMEQVALGDQHQPRVRRQQRQRLLDARRAVRWSAPFWRLQSRGLKFQGISASMSLLGQRLAIRSRVSLAQA